MDFRDYLLLLNLFVPLVLVWMFKIERSIGKIEGYCKGRTRCEDKTEE